MVPARPSKKTGRPKTINTQESHGNHVSSQTLARMARANTTQDLTLTSPSNRVTNSGASLISAYLSIRGIQQNDLKEFPCKLTRQMFMEPKPFKGIPFFGRKKGSLCYLQWPREKQTNICWCFMAGKTSGCPVTPPGFQKQLERGCSFSVLFQSILPTPDS